MFIDTHAHLDSLEDLEDAIIRAEEGNVGRIVAVSSNLASSYKTSELGEKFENVYTAVGIHPHDASEYSEDALAEIAKIAKGQKVVAIGETGLDYHYMNSTEAEQKESFRKQIQLAKKLRLPVVVHIRDAHDDVLEIIKDERAWETMGVIHCYTGDYETARKYLDQGFYISFSGIVTFKKSIETQDAARNIPLDRILVETDSPYLAPAPKRGKPNEPSYVRYVAEKIAELRNVSIEKVEEETTTNAKNLFLFEPESVPESIVYKLRNSLYLNITNRCTIACLFCGKWKSFMLRDYNLRIKQEPSAEEILEAAGDPTGVDEVVFVGWGEPLMRPEVVIKVAGVLKGKGVNRVRVDTDGLANLVHKRNVAAELAGTIDAVSISLNAQDAETYAKICPSKYGERAYPAVLEFIKESKKHIPQVTASVVTVPGVDVERCRNIVEEIGEVKFRARTYGSVG